MGKKYLLIKEKDGIYLKLEDDDAVLNSVALEQIYKDLNNRKINFDFTTVESCYTDANGELIKIAFPVENPIIEKTILKILANKDQTKAYLQVCPLVNGEKFEAVDVEKALQENGIKYGIKTELFPQIVQYQSEFKEWLIAEGIACIDGENASLVYNFSPSGIDIKPQELADGSVDFYNLNLIQTVEPGQVLIEKIPAKQGTDGITVLGQERKAKIGKDVALPIGSNTQATDNNTKLIATTMGHVVLSNRKVCVLPSYEVKGDVDFNTGNIRFPGNVLILGNVKNNFEVEATGDVEVRGNLEGTVKSDSNIQVKKGIVRGKAIAKGSIYARYIENGNAESGENIIVTDAVMHSMTKAVKKVIVGGKKGLLVGGTCCAGEEIRAKNIGSSLGTSTTMEVGIQPESRQEYKDVNHRLVQLQEDYSKNDKIIKSLQEMKQKTGSLPGIKNELFMKICRIQYQIGNEIEELKRRKTELDILFYDMEKARICVEDSIHTGTNIIMGKSVFNVVEEMKYVEFTLDGYDIKYGPLKRRNG